MTRRQKLVLILLTTVTLSPLWAFNYGARLNFGLSSGTGSEWYKTLDQAGSISFNKVLPTVGIGVFTEFDMTPDLLFTPELNYVLNRGTAMADDFDNFIRTQTVHSIEILLPLAHDFKFDSGNKAFRILGGFQLLYSFNLEQSIKINGDERFTEDMKNLKPFSMGFVLGGGLEFRKQKKMSWFLDMRMIIPASVRIEYSQPDGSTSEFKTLELLFGSGIKF